MRQAGRVACVYVRFCLPTLSLDQSIDATPVFVTVMKIVGGSLHQAPT